MPGVAVALLGLCALALCGQPALSIMGTNTPPEDLDGSGDDDDAFSGSGAGASLETPLLDLRLLSRKTAVLTTTLTAAPAEPTHASPGQASAVEREASGEGSAGLPGRGPEAESAPSHEPTHSSPAVTLPSTAHRPLTVGATTASDPSVVEPRVSTPEPPSSGGEGPLASGAPESDGQPDRGSTQHLGEESSGSGSDDFTFAPSGEKPASPLERNKPDQEVIEGEATGASQGILDRKEVLGGVIAGGLVGLLFAVFLVGFMLYRMKKKDEGSYSLEEPKQANGAYQKPQRQEEFYA
ncbi:syndecan-1 isoform X2 [Phascolarctos cinereus]|uniref:Syndecan n=1 Tax=Phascolarctos cinereus TaxID=38626 RepID=A0A6P5IVZ6_PHACI|nr:syndecan-1 isoform X2 [Phascolarctos cinereus]